MSRFIDWGSFKAINGKVPIIRNIRPVDGTYDIDMKVVSTSPAPMA